MADPIDVLTMKVDALAQGMAEGFAAVDRRFDGIDGRLDAHDARFDGIDAQLADIPAHFAELRAYIDTGLEKTQTTLKGEIARVERKLDQVIDRELRR